MAASLVRDFEIPVFAIKGEDDKTYYQHIHSALDLEPQITMDDGADVVSVIHKEKPGMAAPPVRAPGCVIEYALLQISTRCASFCSDRPFCLSSRPSASRVCMR